MQTELNSFFENLLVSRFCGHSIVDLENDAVGWFVLVFAIKPEILFFRMTNEQVSLLMLRFSCDLEH